MKKSLWSILVVCLLLGGCAFGFIPMSEDTVREKTALALGLSPGEISIMNLRRDSGPFMGTEYYDVKTNTGKMYSCTIIKGSGAAAPPDCKAK